MGDIISILSFLAALMAAGFAMRSAEQARRANELNLVKEKIKIYEAVHSVHMHNMMYGSRIDSKKAEELLPVALRAKLILNESLAEQFSTYHFKVVEKSSMVLASYDQDPDGYNELLAVAVEVRLRGKKLIEDLENDLRKNTQDSWRPS